MNDQDKNSNQEKPVYLNELDDGTRRRAQRKGAPKAVKRAAPKAKKQSGSAFLISLMLFIFVLVAGLAALLLTGKIILPF